MQMTVRRRIVMMGRMITLLQMAAAPKKGFDDNVLHSVGIETDEENDDNNSFMAGDAIGRVMRG